MSDIRLSVLITSLAKRSRLLYRLLTELEVQKTPEIEVLVECDSGEKTVGYKRQKLLEASRGTFVAYVDDDDQVSESYLQRILEALEGDPDCCGMQGEWRMHGFSKKIIWGLEYDWKKIDNVYYIGTNHITPVKREIALQCGFPDISIGEDQEYGRRVRRIAKKEIKIGASIYFYNCNPKHPETIESLKRHKR